MGEYAANVDAVLKAIWQEERPAIDEAGRMLAPTSRAACCTCLAAAILT